MNVIVLMAGSGKDFEERGHVYPKYFLEINGQPIIQRVVESLKPSLYERKTMIRHISAPV